MNNELPLKTRNENSALVMNQLLNVLLRPVEWLAGYYSRQLQQPVGAKQTLWLLSAQLAFIMTVYASSPLLLHIGFLLWFLKSLQKCRECL